jgi:branched-chain amino acid transport system ATP-binding protein
MAAAVASSPCLVLDTVSRSFGGLNAVDRVSLTIHPGERRAVIGPNGAGKTTLFNLISGELPVTGGTVTWLGSDITKVAAYRRAARGIARTFQVTRLFGNLTARDNVLLACAALDRRRFTMHRRLSGCTSLIERADRLLDDFGLGALRHERARNLSYGDQRKLEVALSMAGRPQLLLLDEPMAGLSSRESRSMQALLDQLDPATAVLLIEHDMDMAFAFAEKITVMYQGGVLTTGRREEIGANPAVQQIYLGRPVD